MSRAKFLKGTKGTLDGREYTFLRQVDTGVWQLEDNATGELRRVPKTELLDHYLAGKFKFVEINPPSAPDGKAKRKENAVNQFSLLSEKLKDRAKHRRTYIQALLTELGATLTRGAAEEIIQKVWKEIKWPEKPPHYVTVWRWLKRYLPAGNDIRSIVDRFNRCGNHEGRLPAKLVDIMSDAVDRVYLAEERGTIQDTLDHALTEVKRENCLRVASQQLPTPRLRQIKRLIDRVPAFDRYAARHGRQAAERHFRSVLKNTVTSFPLERVEIDHTRMDVFVVDEETMLPLGRPWLTLCIDFHTRCILGYDLSFDPPSHLTVARCLRHALLPKGNLKERFPAVKGTWDMFGVMETLVCDNGAEFHCESLEVGCLTLGITLQYCPRKEPWFKGSIERMQGSLNRGVAHGVPGTTFSNILEKGDYDAALKARVTLATLREAIHVWIVDYYHQRPHKTLGDTPAHAWHTETIGMDLPMPADPAELKAILGKVDTRQLTHKGIELHGLFYNSAEAGLIARRLGNNLTVTISQQDDDLGQIHLLVPDTDTYLPVPAIDRDYAQGLTLWQHRVCKRFAKRHLEGRTDPTALAEAKRRITELVEADFGRKARKTRVRPHRFLGKKSPMTQPPPATPSPKLPAGSDHPTVDIPPSPTSISVRRFTPILQQRASDTAA